MREYRPSKHFAPYGLIVLLLAAFVGGAVIGGIVFAVDHYIIYLIVVFPFIIGAMGGFVMPLAVALGKVRNPMLAALFGLLIAVVLYGTYRYADYRIGFKDDLNDEIEQEFGERLDDEELQVLEDLILTEETGSTGFTGYIKLYAQEGITVTSTRSSSDSGLTLKGILAYLYWIVEFGIIAVISLVMAMNRAEQPFSEEAGQWFGSQSYLGTMPLSGLVEFLALVKASDFTRAGGFLADQWQMDPPRIDVSVSKTKMPEADMVLVIQRLSPKKSGGDFSIDDVEKGLITPAELEALRRGMQAETQSDRGQSS